MAKLKKCKMPVKKIMLTDEVLSASGRERVNGIIQSAYMKMQSFLVADEVALPGRTVKSLSTIEIKGWAGNGGERIIEQELIDLLGKETLEADEGYNTIFPIFPCGVVKAKTKDRGTFYTVFEVTAETEDEFDLSIAEYRYYNSAFYLHILVYAEGIRKRLPISEMDIQYAAIDTFFLGRYSRENLSDFSDLELDVLSRDIPENEANSHSSAVMNYTVSAFRCVNFIKNYGTNWPTSPISYVDNDYYVIKNWQEDEESTSENTGMYSDAGVEIQRIIDTEPSFSIIPRNSLGELLPLIAEKGISTFYSAVGFAYKSGLKSLQAIFEKGSCNSELIIGSLQNYAGQQPITKMDRASAEYINSEILNRGVAVFTYPSAFYHGKFYYLSNEEKAYIIVGSSNISKAAFQDSFELDVLYVTERGSDIDLRFVDWYRSLRDECERIDRLDCNLFYEHKWNSELDAYSLGRMRRVPTEEMLNRLPGISNEDTRFRVKLWMQHEPVVIYENHRVTALKDYTMFVYPENKMVAFECLLRGNAYYVFRCTEGVDHLLNKIAHMSKGHMMLLPSDILLDRGYHLKNQIVVERKIAGYFVK